jgi:hypothetical protein
VAGALSLLDGTAVPGAPVIIQARSVSRRGEVVSERTVAETQTGPTGQWTVNVTVPEAKTPALALRALFPGSPSVGASLSEGVRLPAAVR